MARIGILHPNLNLKGGAENVSLNVIEALQDSHSIEILTLTQPNISHLNEYFNTSVNNNIPVQQRSPLGPISASASDVASRFYGSFQLGEFEVAAVSRIFQAYWKDYDILISTKNELNLPDESVQYIHHPNFFPNKIRENDPTLVTNIYDYLCKKIARFESIDVSSSVFYANSKWTAKLVQDIYGRKPYVLYPPVETEGYPEIDWNQRENGFIAVGRVTPFKNIGDIIEIIEGVRSYGYDVHLHIVGTIPDNDYQRNLLRNHKHKPFVEFEGSIERKKLKRMISNHKYGIHGKRKEHFGMAVAELLSGGAIPFVPDGGGQVEIIHQQPELMYESADEAIDKITTLIDNHNTIAQVKSNLPSAKDQFGRERFHNSIRSIVNQKLKNE